MRNGERNEELAIARGRSSTCPTSASGSWATSRPGCAGVEHVHGNRIGTIEANVVDNLRLACEHVEAERFVVFNDDFYVMAPIEPVPSWHEGPLAERIARAARSLRATAASGVGHAPGCGIGRAARVDPAHPRSSSSAPTSPRPSRRLAGRRFPPEWRTVHGNLHGVAGEQAPDVKVRRRSDPIPDGPFLSTSDGTLALVRKLLAARSRAQPLRGGVMPGTKWKRSLKRPDSLSSPRPGCHAAARVSARMAARPALTIANGVRRNVDEPRRGILDFLVATASRWASASTR